MIKFGRGSKSEIQFADTGPEVDHKFFAFLKANDVSLFSFLDEVSEIWLLASFNQGETC